MRSLRLTYEPLAARHLEIFHSLVVDEHIRRYLMDGNVFSKEWCEERIRDSQRLTEGRGAGLWLAYELQSDEPVGFCGFIEFPTLHPDPQLVYALRERFTGKGYATEMGLASILQAREQCGFDPIIASVDRVNAASLHILEKLGFERVSTQEGSFGEIYILELRG